MRRHFIQRYTSSSFLTSHTHSHKSTSLLHAVDLPFALHVLYMLCWLHKYQHSNVSTKVSERNFNNVPTIKSLLLGRSKCTNSKKVCPLYRELYLKKHHIKFMKYVKP